MEGADAILRGDVLGGATSVTGRVLRVDECGRVQGLVHITDVVNDHSEGKGALVGLVAEFVSNLLGVGGLRGADLVLQELGVGVKGLDDISIRLGEAEVIEGSALLIKVGLVDVMPVALEGVSLALDVVGKGGALSEGVVLLLNEVGVVLSEDS